MDKSKQPGIKFNGIILVKELFEREADVPEDSELKFNFVSKVSQQAEEYNLHLLTEIKLIYEEKEVLLLNSYFVGHFSTIPGEENMDIDEYMESNAVGLMFPYVREHISSITQKAGISPILLPPINVMAIIKENNRKNKD